MYKEYLKYEFDKNPQFKAYMTSIYPPPPSNKLEYYRKKFYKQFVDHDLDLDYDPYHPQSGEPRPRPEEKKTPQPATEPEHKSLPLVTEFQMMLFAAGLVCFPIGLAWRSFYHGLPLALAFLVALLKKYGIPRFEKVYWQALLMDEHFHNLVGTVVCILTMGGTIAVWYPIILRAAMFISESLHFMANQGNGLAKLVDGVNGKVAANKETLLNLKAGLEVYVGFYLILSTAMRWTSLIMLLFYWQMMQVKYTLSGYSRLAMDALAGQMDWLIAHPSCPFFLRWILKGLRKAGAYAAKLGQPAQPQEQPQSQPQAQTH